MVARLISNIKLPILLFIVSRLIFIAAMPLEALRGYGDFSHFYNLSKLGAPYFDFWVEFPPLFPFLSALISWLSAGREHVYDYLLVFILTAAQVVSLGIFLRLADKIHRGKAAERRGWIYFGLLLGLAYGWWYFDPLAVMLQMLGLLWILDQKVIQAGVAIGLGILLKFFPGLLLVVAWWSLPFRKALNVTLIACGIVLLVYGSLMLTSPAMTIASLRSQGSKGSWETIWALIDGNLQTGNFGSLNERSDPETALLLRGNPAQVPAWLSLIPFVGLGVLILSRKAPEDDLQRIALLGLTWGLFLLWSTGYSPQWVLYLLPVILLILPEKEALLFGFAFIFVNLLEWPVLLSRGYFWGLWLTVPLRYVLLILFSYSCVRIYLSKAIPEPIRPVIGLP